MPGRDERLQRFIDATEAGICARAVDFPNAMVMADRIFSGRPTLAAIGPVDTLMAYDDLCARLAP